MASDNTPTESMNNQQSGPDEAPRISKCRTKPFLDKFSICVNEDRLCVHALFFGFKYLCNHPKHKEFFDKENQGTFTK